MIFNGGTLDTAGFSETAGTLTLLANSALNFGNPARYPCRQQRASRGPMPRRSNCSNGSAPDAGGGTTQFFVGGAQPCRPAQLAAIDFINPVGYAPASTMRSNSRQAKSSLQAVPEPAALGLIGFAGTALLARRRTTKR